MKKGVSRPIYKIDKVEQKFNLKTLLGYTPSNKQREEFFDRVADRIVERTADGKDINGKNFKPYSKKYADKKGVSVTSVDLILKGDMLRSIEPAPSDDDSVIIAIDEKQTKKAYNHNVGDTLKKRTFFGLTKGKEIDKIVNDVDMLKPKEDITDLAALRAAISKIFIEVEE